MSTIQLLESIATNPDYKSNMLLGETKKELHDKIQDSIDELGNIPMWCIFVPPER